MLRVFAIVLTLAFVAPVFVPEPASAQNCNYASDRAKDGSRCGGRAADQRSGGR